MVDFVTPPPMERGDRVGVVAPAAGAAAEVPHVYEQGLDRLRSVFDLEPVEFPTAERDSEYLEANPAKRARDVEDAFRDPEIAGVIATIGGHEQIRILDHLDPSVLRANPTRFFGYSDNTNLALALWNEGVVSYQGPMVLTQLAMGGGIPEYTVEHVQRAFFGETMGEVRPADRFTDETLDWNDESNLNCRPEFEDNPGWRWHNADADPVTGRVWGGSLEIVSMHLMADGWLPDPERLDGCVLFAETCEELRAASWVHEVLTSMGERGLLERFGGVVVGRPKTRHHADREPAERAAFRERQREVVADVFDRYSPGTPVLFDFDCGHTDPIAPVPLGSRVTLEPGTDVVTFQEP